LFPTQTFNRNNTGTNQTQAETNRLLNTRRWAL
jgi:hypothetical protein